MKAKCIAFVLGCHFNIRAEQRVFFQIPFLKTAMMSRPLFEGNLEDGSFFFDAVEEHDVAGILALYDEDDEIFDHHDFTNRDDEGANAYWS